MEKRTHTWRSTGNGYLLSTTQQFAEYYTAEKAEIPEEWGRFTKEDIVQDIQDNYHVTVDLAKYLSHIQLVMVVRPVMCW